MSKIRHGDSTYLFAINNVSTRIELLQEREGAIPENR
jgi:hypothetical protein